MTKKILIIGATSFVANQFLKIYGDFFKKEKISVTLTFRTPKKIPQTLKDDSFYKLEQLDTYQKEDVFKMISDKYLVINFAGPFNLYSENVVEACAHFGVHYIDITGEFQFAKRMMTKYQQIAEASKAKIIHFCGFDSIPSEYAVFLSSQIAQDKKLKIESIDILYKLRGGFNGGTIKTAFEFDKSISNEDFLNRAYLLNQAPPSLLDNKNARYLPEINQWGIPFFMEPINSKVIYYSSYKTAPDGFMSSFRYNETMAINGGKIPAFFASKFSSQTDFLLKNKLTKNILSKFLPKPGEGPSEKLMNSGFMKGSIVTRFSDGTFIKGDIFGKGDPGNIVTSKCLGSAMKAILDEKFNENFGIMTPAIAFGRHLIPYLEIEGIHFNFHKHT